MDTTVEEILVVVVVVRVERHTIEVELIRAGSKAEVTRVKDWVVAKMVGMVGLAMVGGAREEVMVVEAMEAGMVGCTVEMEEKEMEAEVEEGGMVVQKVVPWVAMVAELGARGARVG